MRVIRPMDVARMCTLVLGVSLLMRKDHSWDASAREYVKVYRAMLKAEG